MPNEPIVNYGGPAPNPRQSRDLVRRYGQIQTRGAVQSMEVQREALVSGTRITAGASLGNMVMPMLGSLSKLADQLTEVAPTGAHRYDAIADAVTVLAIEEIIGLGRGQ